MTMSLEMQIEELRLELNHCDPAERRQIATELEMALRSLQSSKPSRTTA